MQISKEFSVEIFKGCSRRFGPSKFFLCVTSAFLCASAVNCLLRQIYRRGAEERRGYAEKGR